MEVDIQVPEIGDFSEIPITEILVKVGDRITAGQSVITVESDKATMEIPASHGGIVKEILVSLGDPVSFESRVLIVEADEQPKTADKPKDVDLDKLLGLKRGRVVPRQPPQSAPPPAPNPQPQTDPAPEPPAVLPSTPAMEAKPVIHAGDGPATATAAAAGNSQLRLLTISLGSAVTTVAGVFVATGAVSFSALVPYVAAISFAMPIAIVATGRYLRKRRGLK